MNPTYADNERLIREAKAGNEEAMAALVEGNMGLVKSIATRFLGRGTEYEDLVQIGVIGMIKAVRSFDFSFGTVFSTYAVPMIIGQIKRHLRDDGPVKVGRGTKRLGVTIMQEKERFWREEGREPRLSELAERLGMAVEDMVFALEAMSPIRSLSEPLGEEEDLLLGDTIVEKGDEIAQATESIALRQAIATLPEMERRLISLRYFHRLSQQKTAEMLGLTQVKVSREEKKIMGMLRQKLL